VPVYVDRAVETVVEVPVDKVVERFTEVPVDRVVITEVSTLIWIQNSKP